MLYILADNYSKQNGWSWQGALLGAVVLAAVVITVVMIRRK